MKIHFKSIGKAADKTLIVMLQFLCKFSTR